MINSNFKHRVVGWALPGNFDLGVQCTPYRRYFYIACFTVLSIRLLSSLTGTLYADSTTDDGKKLSQDRVLASSNPTNTSGLELLQAYISVAQGKNNTKSAEQLKQIIEQIRSIEFKPQKQAPEPVVIPENAPAIEPNETVPDEPNMPAQKEKPKPEDKARLPYEPITDQTLQMLRTLAQEPEKLENPLELAETVFASGNEKEASLFYSEALKRKDPNDIGSSSERAWILFQIGNCLRNSDLPAAAKTYQQLLTEYPNSPWTELARARSDLIAWYLKDEPDKLMLQVKKATSQKDEIK
jgi:tetratricopeptide (TPR) repeat protein